MPTRAKVTEEQRGEAALRLIRKEENASTIARELGVSEPTIYQWRDRFLKAGHQAMGDGRGEQGEVKRLTQDIAERDRIIGEQTVALTVLKKTLGLSR